MNSIIKKISCAVLCTMMLQPVVFGAGQVQSKSCLVQRALSFVGGCIKNYWKPALATGAAVCAAVATVVGTYAYKYRWDIAAIYYELLAETGWGCDFVEAMKVGMDPRILEKWGTHCVVVNAMCKAASESDDSALLKELVQKYPQFINDDGYPTNAVKKLGFDDLVSSVKDPIVFSYQKSRAVKATPLVWAIVGKHTNNIRYLVAKNAKITYEAIFEAAAKGLYNIVELFIEKCDKTELKGLKYEACVGFIAGGKFSQLKKFVKEKQLLQNPKEISFLDQELLLTAARYGRLKTVEYLISKGLDINFKGHNGITAIHRAAQYGKLDIVKYLTTLKVNINEKSKKGKTPLFLAVEGALGDEKIYFDIIKLLVEHGAIIGDEDIKYSRGDVILYLNTARDYRLAIENFKKNKNSIKAFLEDHPGVVLGKKKYFDLIRLTTGLEASKIVSMLSDEFYTQKINLLQKIKGNETIQEKIEKIEKMEKKRKLTQGESDLWSIHKLCLAVKTRNIGLLKSIFIENSDLWELIDKITKKENIGSDYEEKRKALDDAVWKFIEQLSDKKLNKKAAFFQKKFIESFEKFRKETFHLPIVLEKGEFKRQKNLSTFISKSNEGRLKVEIKPRTKERIIVPIEVVSHIQGYLGTE